MKVSELIEKLQEYNPDAEVWLPNINELNIPGYCVPDHLMSFQFNEVVSDIIYNPGEIDYRLLKNKKDDTYIVYLGSKYDLIRDKELLPL